MTIAIITLCFLTIVVSAIVRDDKRDEAARNEPTSTTGRWKMVLAILPLVVALVLNGISGINKIWVGRKLMREASHSDTPEAHGLPPLSAQEQAPVLTAWPNVELLCPNEKRCRIETDLDGDGEADVAQLVGDTSNREEWRKISVDPNGRIEVTPTNVFVRKQKIGIAFDFANGKHVLLGAGRTLGPGGDDLDWMRGWDLAKREEKWPARLGARPPLVGDGLLIGGKGVMWLVYWSKSDAAFRWVAFSRRNKER
jgi:hypothetical protein